MGLGPGGLGVVRSLAGLGVEVHGVYSSKGADVGRHSRALRARYRVDHPGSVDEVLSTLRGIRRRVRPDERMVLIPANDTYARFVSVHRAELAEGFVFRVPPPGIESTFLDKRATVEVCLRQRMPIPRSCVPDDLADVERAAGDFRFPVIIKPALQDDPGFPGKNVVVADRRRLPRLLRQPPRPHLAHDVPGAGPQRRRTHRRRQHLLGRRRPRPRLDLPSTSSASGCRTTARAASRSPRPWTRFARRRVRFLDGLGYVGFTGVEYAEDTVTGQRLFLELNARVVLPQPALR